jgi:hypothetical protein
LRRNQLILGLVVLAALTALVFWGHDKIPFDFHEFRLQLVKADWVKIAVALACIYAGYVIRSVRWALLLRHHKKVAVLSLVGTQVIGFTCVALIGRVADLVRPYLVSKKTSLELSSQIAVYVVERLFDVGAVALIFSLAILQVPQTDVVKAMAHSGHLASLSQNAPGTAAFIFRYGGLVLTALGALFLVGIRLIGGGIASLFETIFGLVSKKLGRSVGHKIRVFRSGLDTMRSFTDFASTASLSILMWVLIALAYLEVMRAFVASPQLATISITKCVLLMVVSGGASIVQLPVLGWFTQIGVVAAAIASFFGAAPEASTACAATLLLVSFLGIVPVGLIWAQFEHVSLRKVAAESGHAGEELSGTAAAEFPD